jgi:hypothetical protein
MPARSSRIERINELIQQMNAQEQPRQGMELGLELSNELMLHFGMPEEYVRDKLDVLDDAYANSEFSNQKMETWFYKHPILGNARIALHHVQVPDLAYESQFYMLSDELSKARVAATANLFSHWEDSDLTKFPTYKVGLHFFVSYDGRAFYLVLTKDTNIRVLELNERLSNTQSDILESLKNVLSYQTIEENEPQQTIHAQLWKALELSEVNKRFYEGVAEAFMVLVQHLQSNDYEKKEAQLFSSRLLGRLIFIWFLRKKNIIHESMGYFDPIELSGTEYYSKKLKPLFFDTLNTPMEQRKHTDIITPYLNGGLFEAHENDWIQQSIPFPIDWFKQLYEHLNKFNFTTDESTPEYEQVAIDPEMLGRVFENLLATVVPETSNAASDRKNKGAFYTPREIVSFMTKETLKQYLKTKIDNEKHHFGIDQLIDMNDAKFLEQKSTGDIQIWGKSSKEVQEKIISALDSIKILDPACGSGAFPIGMMQLLSQTYERVQAIYVAEEGEHRLAKGTDRFNSYKTKLHIIQSSLFGSDIEPMAIEIARLRTWLSLIVEDMSKIEPLPNLDFNFVCSNSLITLANEEQISIFDDMDYEDRLNKLRNKFFSTHGIKQKLKLKQEFYNIYDEKLHSSANSERINQLRTWNPFDSSFPSDFFDSSVMFNVSNFDIVIGNPPYIGQKNNKQIFDKIKESEINKFSQGKMDYFYYFIHLALNVLKELGVVTYITTNYYLRNDGAIKLRKDIFERADILKLIDFDEITVFDSAKGQHDMISIFRKGSSRSSSILITPKNEVLSLRNESLKNYLSGDPKYTQKIIVEKEKLYESVGYGGQFYIRTRFSNDSIEDLLNRLSEFPKLKDNFNLFSGINSGADSVSNNHVRLFPELADLKGDPIYVFDKDTFMGDHYNKMFLKPFYKPSDITKWVVKKPNRLEVLYLREDINVPELVITYLERYKKILVNRPEFRKGNRPWYVLHRARSEDIFQGEKIVFSSLSKSNDFAYHEGDFYAPGGSSGGIFFIKTTSNKLNLKFLCAILNSRLIFLWLSFKGKKMGTSFAMSARPIGEIPIMDDMNYSLVEKILDSFDILSNLDLKNNHYVREVDHLNELVYKLYRLSDMEIEMVNDFYLKSN